MDTQNYEGMKNLICRNIMLALLVFLGLGALGGGFALMISPDGH